MGEIRFPALDLNITVSKIAFKFGNITIYWYAIFIVISIIIAILCLNRERNKFEVPFEKILELSLWLFPISIICARLYYCAFQLSYYLDNPLEIFQLRHGGLAIYGGILGGIFTIIIFCKRNKIKIVNMLDRLVPYLALGQAIGRWGNFINIEAYGESTQLPWRMGIWENGIYKEVHPTFLYEFLVTFIIFIIIIKKGKKRKFKGEFVCIYLLIYSLGRSIIEQLRTDSLFFFNIRISQALSILIFITTLIYYIWKIIKINKVHRKSTNT